MSLNAFPAKKMQFAIGPDGLDHVVGYSVATLATSYCRLFSHISVWIMKHSLTDIQDAPVRQFTVDDARGTRERMFFRLSFAQDV